jgi:hypothetical protein
MSVEQTLQDRGTRYGDFATHALITQALKDVMSGEFAQAGETEEKQGLRKVRWLQLQPMPREALEMIVHKIGRILNGDPNYADSWHEIAGYAKLVEDRLPKD